VQFRATRCFCVLGAGVVASALAIYGTGQNQPRLCNPAVLAGKLQASLPGVRAVPDGIGENVYLVTSEYSGHVRTLCAGQAQTWRGVAKCIRTDDPAELVFLNGWESWASYGGYLIIGDPVIVNAVPSAE
jgi:hypothetical protein